MESYLEKLPGKDRVRIVRMDWRASTEPWSASTSPRRRSWPIPSTSYASSPNIFLACWREIDPAGSKHRGLLSLKRHRHNLKPNSISGWY
jgi:hypothetical protein